MIRVTMVPVMVLLSLMLLAGCWVQSLYPFYTDKTRIAIPDSINGAWNLIGEGKDDIARGYPEPWLFSDKEIICYERGVKVSLVSVYFKVEDVLFVDVQAGRSFSEEGNRWLSAHQLSVHQVYKVVVKGEQMVLYPLDFEWVEEQIKSGAIKLSHHKPDKPVTESKYADAPLVLTENSEGLTKFLKHCIANSGAWNDEISYTFRKVANNAGEKAFWQQLRETGQGTPEEGATHISSLTEEVLQSLERESRNNPHILDVTIKAALLSNRGRILGRLLSWGTNDQQITEEHCVLLYEWLTKNQKAFGADEVRANLARVPATPFPLVLKLVESNEDKPLINAIKSNRLPLPMVTNLINRLVLSTDFATKAFVAYHPVTSPEQLDSLAQDGLKQKSGGFGELQHYEVDVVDGLPIIAFYLVDIVARNPNTPLKTIQMLGEQKDLGRMYKGLGSNPKTSGDVLVRIADSPFGANRYEPIRAVIANPNLPKEKMLEYAAPEYSMVHRELCKNTSLPIELIQSFSADKNADVRAAIASNPSTPIDILKQLAKDGDYRVPSRATKELKRRENEARVPNNLLRPNGAQ